MGKNPILWRIVGKPAMVGFIGQSENSIDDKGRVALPARMRRELSPDAQETFVASRGIEKCITLVPLNIWEAKAELLRKLNAFNKDNRTVKRKESRWSEVVTLDAQGRISLARHLIEYAELTSGKAIVLGATDSIEIWDPEILRAEDDALADTYTGLVERVMNRLDDE